LVVVVKMEIGKKVGKRRGGGRGQWRKKR